jgi:nucleotide-binding universal stress UspA family protein
MNVALGEKSHSLPAANWWYNAGMQLRGLFRILFLYDVAESIDLGKLRTLLGAQGGAAEQAFPRRTPGYVRFEHPPIVEPAEIVSLFPGVDAACPVKYYAFGAIVIQADVPFECDWNSLVEQGARWMDAPDVEPRIRDLARRRLERIGPAVNRPTDDWLQENYLVVEIHEIRDAEGQQPTADELVASHGGELVQLIRGETVPLALKSHEEALQVSLSYYPSDLVVVGSHGAVVYDRAEDAAAVTQVLEYAKMQLLEFRYYDKFMTRVLADFYTALERKRNALLSRWSLPREAQRFNTIRLDVMDLTERIDNAIKFVSDIYYARVYRLAATRMGVQDYRNLVEQKLDILGELHDSMADRFNETRSFVLEVLVALLTVLDVILLFRGR